MNFPPNKRFPSENSDFSDPEDEDLADEMNYMSESIASKDFDSLRQKPEVLQRSGAKSTQPSQKQMTPTPAQTALAQNKIHIIREQSIEFSECSSPPNKFLDPEELISDRLNQNFKVGGHDHALDILSIKDRQLIQKSLGIIQHSKMHEMGVEIDASQTQQTLTSRIKMAQMKAKTADSHMISAVKTDEVKKVISEIDEIKRTQNLQKQMQSQISKQNKLKTQLAWAKKKDVNLNKNPSYISQTNSSASKISLQQKSTKNLKSQVVKQNFQTIQPTREAFSPPPRKCSPLKATPMTPKASYKHVKPQYLNTTNSVNKLRAVAAVTVKTTVERKLKLKGTADWGANCSPQKLRPESHLRTKSVSKKMGHSKTNSLINRLYSGNKPGAVKNDKHCQPVKDDLQKKEQNEKVLKYLEESLAQFESQILPVEETTTTPTKMQTVEIFDEPKQEFFRQISEVSIRQESPREVSPRQEQPRELTQEEEKPVKLTRLQLQQLRDQRLASNLGKDKHCQPKLKETAVLEKNLTIQEEQMFVVEPVTNLGSQRVSPRELTKEESPRPNTPKPESPRQISPRQEQLEQDTPTSKVEIPKLNLPQQENQKLTKLQKQKTRDQRLAKNPSKDKHCNPTKTPEATIKLNLIKYKTQKSQELQHNEIQPIFDNN